MSSTNNLQGSQEALPVERNRDEFPQEPRELTPISHIDRSQQTSVPEHGLTQIEEISPIDNTEVPSTTPEKKQVSNIETVTEVTAEEAPSTESISQRIDSQSSAETSDSRGKSRRLIRWSKSEASQFGIYWYIPTSIVFLAFCGFFGALGHHLYNQHLDGQVVKNSQWPQRWGLALAFFIKMVLVGSVQLSFKQRAWLTVKKRGFKVKTIDSIFHACYDPAQFFERELFVGAFLPAILALLSWILPLSAIASPSTLSPADGLKAFSGTCANVSTLDFSRENGYGLSDRSPVVNKQGMSYWDMFDNGTNYYNQPSMDHRKIFQLSMLSSSPLQPANPCPSDSNCTYQVNFIAPSYKCEERADFGGLRTNNFTQMAPQGDLLFSSYSSMIEDFVGRPYGWNRTVPDDNTGVFRQEPTLWVAWVINTTLPATAENATSWNTSYWRHQLVPHVMECIMYNSTYSYELSFLQGKMSVDAAEVTPNELLLAPGDIMAPYMDIYQEFSAFHGSGFLYRDLLAGNVTMAGEDSWVITNSDISQTSLIDPGSGFPLTPDMPKTIETGFQTIYLSLLSDVVQYSQVDINVPCQISSHVLVWRYQPTWLAVSYIIAIILTLAAATVGLHAVLVNGYVIQTNFSTFLATTRNPDLDEMAKGSCLGSWPMKKDFGETTLRFGETVTSATSSERLPHAAFGFPSQVRMLERGKVYE